MHSGRLSRSLATHPPLERDSAHMPKPNYAFAKRQKELAKNHKK
jgi:hypothetical protein